MKTIVVNNIIHLLTGTNIMFYIATDTAKGALLIPNKIHKLKDIELGDIIIRTFILFTRAADVLFRYANARLQMDSHLSTTKFIALRTLAIHGGRMRPSEIAEWTFRERHNITTLVDRLKKDGLVRTEQNDTDKRSVDVVLTPKGRSVLRQAIIVAGDIVNVVMNKINESDCVQLERSLRILRKNAYSDLENLLDQHL